MLELLFLDRLQFQLETSSNQFGFKSKHGTDISRQRNIIINALVQYIFIILMLQNHLIVLIIGVQSYIDCIMNGMIINHLMYEDDTCIL